ncbi:MAG: RpiB/LacA/LacB family sugar-phosphate isomerase [Parcubacteria group bacterium]|nr:RpiB/LacA/LacB family sugar-phosphate isomerase [Parcubacteria group bacterium]
MANQISNGEQTSNRVIILLGADHRGFKLKEELKNYLRKSGYKYEDLGNLVFEPKDDYPDFAFKVAKKVASKANLGILVCGSGEGMALAANKVKKIRAATAFNTRQVKNLREKNDINILCLAADYLKKAAAQKIVKEFLAVKFSGHSHYAGRIDKIKKIEQAGL